MHSHKTGLIRKKYNNLTAMQKYSQLKWQNRESSTPLGKQNMQHASC